MTVKKKYSSVFWLNHYPRSIKGTIKTLKNAYPDQNVLCVCSRRDLDENRKKMGWEYEKITGVDFVYLQEKCNSQELVEEILRKNGNAYHFLVGMRPTGVNQWILPKLWNRKDIKKIIIAERPTAWPWIRGIFSFLRYLLLSRKINTARGSKPLILAMGKLGVQAYHRTGFRNVFPFLYHKSDDRDFLTHTPDSASTNCENTRFVYVGQFNKRKGVDILKKSFCDQKEKRWSLDLVGANGNLTGEMKEWARTDSRVRFLGAWKSEEVESRLKDYDVCIVPSRYDGWGMVVTEAISSGTGVITTNRTGSRDLVDASGAGIVVKSGSVSELSRAIKNVLESPGLTMEWKNKLSSYREKLSDASISSYTIALLDWYFFKKKSLPVPQCPWLNEN